MNTKQAIQQLKAIEKFTDSEMLMAADFKLPWQSLISTIMSARTRDEVTINVSHNLYKRYPTIQRLASANINEVKKIIKPVNFYITKSKHILETAKILNKKKTIPHDFNFLVSLPGVGRKTANVFLAVQDKPAIGVDTHVQYLSKVLGWTKHTKPHQIEEDLKHLFPKRYWISINYILVGFGRTFKTRKQQVEKLRKEGILS